MINSSSSKKQVSDQPSETSGSASQSQQRPKMSKTEDSEKKVDIVFYMLDFDLLILEAEIWDKILIFNFFAVTHLLETILRGIKNFFLFF